MIRFDRTPPMRVTRPKTSGRGFGTRVAHRTPVAADSAETAPASISCGLATASLQCDQETIHIAALYAHNLVSTIPRRLRIAHSAASDISDPLSTGTQISDHLRVSTQGAEAGQIPFDLRSHVSPPLA